MAQRRMFSRAVVFSDKFCEMSEKARLLYFFLGMEADDDGFVGNPKSIARMNGIDLVAIEELAAAGFILCFDGGVVAIRHWRLNNQIRHDRYHETVYRGELASLDTDEDSSYVYRAPSDAHCGALF